MFDHILPLLSEPSCGSLDFHSQTESKASTQPVSDHLPILVPGARQQLAHTNISTLDMWQQGIYLSHAAVLQSGDR